MELTLKTLSPVHVGNGEELYPLDYIIHKGIYYRITQNQFLKFLGSDLELIHQYANWIEITTKEIESLENQKHQAKRAKNTAGEKDYNQKLNQIRKNFNLLSFVNKHNKHSQFIDFLKQNCKTKIPTELYTFNQIRGSLKTASEEFYVPATSLKGSVRTALLYHFLQEDNNHNNLLNYIRQQFFKAKEEKKKEKAKKFLDDKMDQSCFYCWVEVKDKKIKKDDEKFDLMKLVSFSDAMLVDKTVDFGVGKVDLYLVKKDRKRGWQAGVQKQTPIVEYIPENIDLSTLFNFNIEFFLEVKNRIKYENGSSFIPIAGKKHWIGIVERVEKLFKLDIRTITPQNIEVKRQEVLMHILDCVYKFSEAQKKADQNWLENFSKNDSQKDYAPYIEKGYETVHEYKETIRLGYATGFSGMTELLYIKQTNQTQLHQLFEEIMEYFDIGNSWKNQGEYKANIKKFPKSRRLISEPEVIKPLGWLILAEKGKEPKVTFKSLGEAISVAEQALEAKPEYFKGNRLRGGVELNAKVIKSGKPNKVRVYIAEGNEPEMDLVGYSSEIEEGSIVIVRINNITKKGVIQQVGFKNFKK